MRGSSSPSKTHVWMNCALMIPLLLVCSRFISYYYEGIGRLIYQLFLRRGQPVLGFRTL